MNIVAIIGKSGSGKSSIAAKIEGNNIRSYTTRPPRNNDIDDFLTHLFVDNETWCRQDLDEVVANYYNGVHHYWTTKDMFKEDELSIYVIDIFGLFKLRKSFPDANIIVIYLDASPVILRSRMESRGDSENAIQQRMDSDYYLDKCHLDGYGGVVHIVDADRRFEDVLADVKRIIEKSII